MATTGTKETRQRRGERSGAKETVAIQPRGVLDLSERLPFRTLQRLFSDRVGVSPGWVLRRGRLHAAERVIPLAGERRPISWADLASEFGFADQAHLTRE